MNSYAILPHTADVKLRVRGETLKDLFEQAVLGMMQILSHKATKSEFKNQKLRVKIKVESLNTDTLLIDFLNEILTQSYINKCVYRVSSLKIYDSSIEAEIFGTKVDGFDEDIKAVTYHEAKIIKNQKRKLETMIVFDI